MLDTIQLAIVTYSVYIFAVLDLGDTKALDLPLWYERLCLVFVRGLLVRCPGLSG